MNPLAIGTAALSVFGLNLLAAAIRLLWLYPQEEYELTNWLPPIRGRKTALPCAAVFFLIGAICLAAPLAVIAVGRAS
jgi:hypothetical protein